MTTTERDNPSHEQHAKLARASGGEWARTELALLGAPCTEIKALATAIISSLKASYEVGFADADHHDGELKEGAGYFCFTDRISHTEIALPGAVNAYARRTFCAGQDLMLVNGNHFKADAQIVVVNARKSLGNKASLLTNVVLVLLSDAGESVPEYLLPLLPENIPVLALENVNGILLFMNEYLKSRVPVLHGLVLAGGKSVRMGTDKGLLNYHGLPQREYVAGLLAPVCAKVHLSCNTAQLSEIPASLNPLPDTFLGLGPMGGLLTAMQAYPDAAWLAVACDLPMLDESTLKYLVAQRNPSKYATAFMNNELDFPEPLITIWEPRSYTRLLQFMAMGYSCPRKVLINSDINLLYPPDAQVLQNINDPAAELAVRQRLQSS